MRGHLAILALLAAALAAACGGSPTQPSSGSTPAPTPTPTPTGPSWALSGTVTSRPLTGSPAPVAAARVEILDGPAAGRSSQTDAAGKYTFSSLAQGGFTVQVSAASYVTTSKPVTLTADTTLDFSLDPQARSATGQLTDATRGGPLAGVSIAIDQVGTAVSDGGGQFTIASQAANGTYRLTASGAAVVSRQTAVVFPGTALALTLIRSTFNTAAFDSMTRQFAGALTRWTVPPELVVETSMIAASTSSTALADQVSETEIARLVDRLTRSLPLLTGGTFNTFSSVTRQTTAAGASVSMYRRGTITAMYYTVADADVCGRGGPQWTGSFEVVAGVLWLDRTCVTGTATGLRVMSHELGHALGYGHVTIVPSIMAPVVSIDITGFDQDATTIAFRRPPGNRAPDTDPDDFRVNRPQGHATGGRLVTPAPIP